MAEDRPREIHLRGKEIEEEEERATRPSHQGLERLDFASRVYLVAV